MKSERSVKDGFKPGWQSNIRKHCGTYSEYKAQVKAMGLTEVGYETLPEIKPGKIAYWDDETLMDLKHEIGVDFTEAEARELQALDVSP